MQMELFFFIGIVIFITIFILAFYFSKKEVVKRKLRKLPKKQIRTIRNYEFAKIVGKVEFIGAPLSAPLSGRNCAYYHVLVEKKSSNGKNSNWSDLIEEEKSGKFVIRDGDDYAIVDTRKVKAYLVQDKQYASGFGNDAPLHLQKYLQTHGHSSEGILGFNKTLRYKEGILEEGEIIAVLGNCHWQEIKQTEASIQARKVLVLSPSEEHPHVYLSDDPDTL